MGVRWVSDTHLTPICGRIEVLPLQVVPHGFEKSTSMWAASTLTVIVW